MKDTAKSLTDGMKLSSRSSSKVTMSSLPLTFAARTEGALLSTLKLGSAPPDIPLPEAVLRDVRRDVDEHQAVIVLVRSQVEGIARAGTVQGGNLLGTPDDLDVGDCEAGHALRETDVDAEFFLYESGPGT